MKYFEDLKAGDFLFIVSRETELTKAEIIRVYEEKADFGFKSVDVEIKGNTIYVLPATKDVAFLGDMVFAVDRKAMINELNRQLATNRQRQKEIDERLKKINEELVNL